MNSQEVYTPEDKKLWNKTIIPALERIKISRPNDANVQLLDMVIKNRQFLGIRDWEIMVDGVRLRVSPFESKETVQAKLVNFLEKLEERRGDEEAYTPEDQQFWRKFVIPTLNELEKDHKDDPGFRFLRMMVEKRMMTKGSKESGLNFSVSGIRLETSPEDSKSEVQRKLKAFLESLAELGSQQTLKKRSGAVRREMKRFMGSEWSASRERREELQEMMGSYPFRYTKADKLFWNEVVMPNLQALRKSAELAGNTAFQKLASDIDRAKFLMGPARRIEAQGKVLEVFDEDDQDARQEKLKTFLESLRENIYTPEDQDFWRVTVIPALRELSKTFRNTTDFDFLNLVIEQRIFLKQRDLKIHLAGVSLSLEKTDSIHTAQEKLRAFLGELQKKAEDTQARLQIDLRIKDLQEAHQRSLRDMMDTVNRLRADVGAKDRRILELERSFGSGGVSYSEMRQMRSQMEELKRELRVAEDARSRESSRATRAEQDLRQANWRLKEAEDEVQSLKASQGSSAARNSRYQKSAPKESANRPGFYARGE